MRACQWRVNLNLAQMGVRKEVRRTRPLGGLNLQPINSTPKGAVLNLTRSLARKLTPKTRVNAVLPGIIETPMTVGLIQKRGSISIEETALRRVGQPSDEALR